MITKEEIKSIWEGIEREMVKDEKVSAEQLNIHCANVAAAIRERKKQKQ